MLYVTLWCHWTCSIVYFQPQLTCIRHCSHRKLFHFGRQQQELGHNSMYLAWKCPSTCTKKVFINMYSESVHKHVLRNVRCTYITKLVLNVQQHNARGGIGGFKGMIFLLLEWSFFFPHITRIKISYTFETCSHGLLQNIHVLFKN